MMRSTLSSAVKDARRRLVALLAALVITAGLLVSTSPPRAEAVSYFDIYCEGVRAAFGYYECDGSASISPGQFVRVTLTSAARRKVRFKAFNVDGHHLLGESAEASEGERVFVWRNDTSRAILIEFEANTSGTTGTQNVNARVHVTSY